jgi:hypothetical protein
LKIYSDKGYNEVVIKDDCDFDTFYKVAHFLETEFKIEFSRKLNDLDSNYWDFIYKEQELTLYYNIYLGTSIFPTAFKEASVLTNEMVIEISRLLIVKINEGDI